MLLLYRTVCIDLAMNSKDMKVEMFCSDAHDFSPFQFLLFSVMTFQKRECAVPAEYGRFNEILLVLGDPGWCVGR